LLTTPVVAQDGDASSAATSPEAPTVSETIQVVATRAPEALEPVPASITVISGDELRARGADDLPSALALVAGLSIASGGDGGPASSVPEIWGLREFGRLPADGRWRRAAPSTRPRHRRPNNIERIEILRGPAPVMYGATSVVGVIHVLHFAAGEGQRIASAYGGSHSFVGASVYLPLTSSGDYRQSLAANYDTTGSSADRAGFDRGHLLYRGALAAAGGDFRFDFDATFLQQEQRARTYARAARSPRRRRSTPITTRATPSSTRTASTWSLATTGPWPKAPGPPPWRSPAPTAI
jgi:outer membrane receptor protein involved in Fe transport